MMNPSPLILCFNISRGDCLQEQVPEVATLGRESSHILTKLIEIKMTCTLDAYFYF